MPPRHRHNSENNYDLVDAQRGSILGTFTSDGGYIPRGYSAASLPTPQVTQPGPIFFDTDRGLPAWWDRDHFEWPSFVDNQDVSTSSQTVTNTTDETVVKRFTLNPGAMVKGRVFVFRTHGKYQTAAAEDDVQFKTYIGDKDFDPTAGEGTEISNITTPQENVDPGTPWNVRVVLSVWGTGASGTIANQTEGAFNETLEHNHVDPVTVDTTTAEDIVETITWTNAKSGNSLTRGIAFPEQKA